MGPHGQVLQQDDAQEGQPHYPFRDNPGLSGLHRSLCIGARLFVEDAMAACCSASDDLCSLVRHSRLVASSISSRLLRTLGPSSSVAKGNTLDNRSPAGQAASADRQKQTPKSQEDTIVEAVIRLAPFAT